MKLEEASLLASQIVVNIKHFCDKIEVAGSIRRKRPEVNDIDLVAIPQMFMWTSFEAQLRPWAPKRLKHGNELQRFLIPLRVNTVELDIYRATPQTWGTILLIRTGSKEHNIKLCSRARAMNMMLSAKDGVIKDGKVVASRTEEEIFRALDLDFVPPELRI